MDKEIKTARINAGTLDFDRLINTHLKCFQIFEIDCNILKELIKLKQKLTGETNG